MSMFYCIVCDQCKQRTEAAGLYSGGRCYFHGDAKKTLARFIVTHHGHPIRIVSEHEDDDYFGEEYEEWTADNAIEMEEKAIKKRDYNRRPTIKKSKFEGPNPNDPAILEAIKLHKRKPKKRRHP